MKIYNTLTRAKEELLPIKEGEVTIYACGPTVYDYIHIGNARPLCVFDVLRRYLEWRGMKVRFVQNFTDVDDKIIRRANEEGVTSEEISERFIAEYRTDAEGLGVREATVHPRATQNIAEILDMIQTLLNKGHAYRSANGDVYFRTRSFPEYGKLSHQPIDDLESGARIAVGEEKEDSLDFALWKAAKPSEPYWDSPFGPGRPGWHIECSAMARRYLGRTIDIHCGGQDLIFPHHENEIAQSECANGVPFAHYWMHNGHINVNRKKMSKSLGNFFTVREVARVYGYEAVRFFLISSSYRSPINYSPESIGQAAAALDRLYRCEEALVFAAQNGGTGAKDAQMADSLAERRERFTANMEDDLNTADAIASLFDLVKDINVRLKENALSQSGAQAALNGLRELAGVLGLLYGRSGSSETDEEIEAMISARAKARSEKNWAESDRIRDWLKERGIVVEDTPQGVRWHRERNG